MLAQFTSCLCRLSLLLMVIMPGLLLAANEDRQELPVKEIQELAQVIELIKKNHVTPKSDQELLIAAINGMLASLDDQSRYLTREELALFTQVATGQKGGQRTTNGQVLNNAFVYLDIDYFHASTATNVTRLWQQLSTKTMRGLIIDLRDNPGGFVDSAVAVADLFLDKGLITSSRGRVAEASRNYSATAKTLLIDVPVVVLMNSKTASAAEIVAAALQDYSKATLIGTTTYGKGSIQSLMNTKHGAIQLTTSYYYSPNGRIIHNNGIVPDIVLGTEQKASLADTGQIQYDQQAETDWQLQWVLQYLQQNQSDATN